MKGIGLLWFSTTDTVATAVAAMITFGLFTQWLAAPRYALVPFIDRKALGRAWRASWVRGQCGGGRRRLLAEGRGDVQQCFAILGGAAWRARSVRSRFASARRTRRANRSSMSRRWPSAATRPRVSLLRRARASCHVAPPIYTVFCCGGEGEWRIDAIRPVVGETLPSGERLAIREANGQTRGW